MPHRTTTRKRGKGGPTWRASSHRYFGKVKYPYQSKQGLRGEVLDLVDSVGHSTPLMIIKFEDGQESLLPAPLGIRVHDTVISGGQVELKPGMITQLKNLPPGASVFNIEVRPNENGQLLRSSGTFALVVSNEKEGVVVKLPSKKTKILNPECRATIGVAAGSGRKAKPFMKAGNRYRAMAAKNHKYPKVHGVAMNAVDHPFGGTHRRTTGRSTTRSKGLPPGAKVGLVGARTSGRGGRNRKKE